MADVRRNGCQLYQEQLLGADFPAVGTLASPCPVCAVVGQPPVLVAQHPHQPAAAVAAGPAAASSGSSSIWSRVGRFFSQAPALTTSAALDPPPFTRSIDFWRRCGRVETRKADWQRQKEDGTVETVHEEWSSDGQCVVVHPQLLLTAAHVCFYKLDVEEEEGEPHKKAARNSAASKAVKELAASNAALTALRSDSRHSSQYVAFSHIRAVFVEPQMDGGRVVGRVQHTFECELMRYSDSMDAAVLRIKAMQPAVPLMPFARLTPAEEVAPRCTVALITFKSPLAFTPHEIPGSVLYVEERTKKHGSGGQFTIGETDYLVQGGFSGGAVVRMGAGGAWELVGVHTGTDFTAYGDAAVRAEQGRKRKGVASARPSHSKAAAASYGSTNGSATPRRFSHSASSTRTDGTMSYDPSDEDGPSEVPAEESGDALQHAQTHSARATFFVAERVLQREHWRIPYVLTLPSAAAGGADSSPPRKHRGGTSARTPRCSPIAEEQCEA